jgi:branched-chain amino acid transport system permease protein
MSGALLTLIGLALAFVVMVWWAKRDNARRLVGAYSGDHRRFRTTGSKVGLALGVATFISTPIGFSWIGMGKLHLPNQLIPGLPMNEKWLTTFVYAGIYALGAIGLNVLIGNTGQISLGHAAFIALGAYSTGYFGVDLFKGKIPSVVWLLIAAVLGALVSAAIGPFALRLRGNYLAMVSLFLVFLAEHLAKNWETLTGGDAAPRNDLPGFDFSLWSNKSIEFRSQDTGETVFFGDYSFMPSQRGYFWLTWATVAVVAIVVRNVLRSRQGRAMMAVRDRDLSAEVIGVQQRYTKMWAFALSGACAALAGALYGSFLGNVNPASFNLGFSVNFVAMIIIGGVGTILGSVLGAVAFAVLFDAVRTLFETQTKLLKHIPGVQTDPAKRGFTASVITDLVYGLLIVLFLRFFPAGLVGLWQRLRKWFRTFPFST